MDRIIDFLKYWLRDRWQGESVSRFDTKYVVNPLAPTLGGVRTSKWLLFVLLLLIVLTVLAGLLARITFVSQDALVAQTGGSGCFAKVNGHMYVAVSCLLITYMPTIGYTLLLVAAFIAGYVTRMYIERRMEK